MNEKIELKTRDGICPTYIFHPQGSGPWPTVLLFMDGAGIRQTLFAMAERLTQLGYLVALPDLFYRAGHYNPGELLPLLLSSEGRANWRPRYYEPATNPQNFHADLSALLSYLATRQDVAQVPLRTTGYCMGGQLSLRAAGMFPDRIGAAASFHGGFLATDSPDSPHLLVSKIKGKVYIGAAVNDPSFPDEMRQRLEQSLQDCKLKYTMEVYEAALHGWTMSDFPTYNSQACEQHWSALTSFFAD